MSNKRYSEEFKIEAVYITVGRSSEEIETVVYV